MSRCSHSKPSYDRTSTNIPLTLTFSDGGSSKFNAIYTRTTYRGRHQSLDDWTNENCYSEYYGAYDNTVSEIVGDRNLDRGRIRNTSVSKFHDRHHHCGEVCSQLSAHIDRARARTSNMFGQVINEDEEKMAIALFNRFSDLDHTTRQKLRDETAI